MEIREMQMEDIEKRMSEINEALNAPDSDIDALTQEVDELEARSQEIKEAAEKRSALVAKINAGQIGEVKESHEEKKVMEERTFAPDTVEYRDAYMKNLMGQSMSIEERTALTVAANVIPTETVNKIYGKLEENPLIKAVDLMRIPGYVTVPVATTVRDANWVAMGTAATDSDDVIGKVSLGAKKLIKTIEITADIKAMSIPAFESWLVGKLAQKMEAAICAAIVNGAGSATVPEGIGQCGITYETALSSPGLDDFAAFIGNLGSAYHKNAVWIMSAATFFGKVVPLASDNNGVLVMNGIDYRFLGHPVILDGNVDDCKFKSGSSTDANNADHVIFGSLKDGYVFNFGEGITIEADGSVAFRSGSVVYRAMALCDGAVADDDAFIMTTIA